jgi:alpha-L-rhamnosidase
MTLISRFRKAGEAGRDYRPVPFWSWNDQLDPDEIRWQIRRMKEGGFGGHFMHSRRGLVTPYMGKDWMECVLAACNEARETGVLPWLYDEDCWPSGTGGGRVTSGRPDAQGKMLLHETARPMNFRPEANTVAAFVGVKNDRGVCTTFRRVADLQAARSLRLKSGEALIHFYYETAEQVDVLNRSATGVFLESTHEEYRRLAGRYFGTVVPGIFTDEPQFRNAPPGAAWSLELPEFFRRSNGYELVDHLPELFFPVEGAEKLRFDYHQTLLRLFLLAYTLPIYQWCERNHLALTGHFQGEDTLASQVQYIGAAMPHYEYMHIPGIDHLGRYITSPVLAKQASSVANQFGRKRVLSEMWGCSGQNVNLEELRWIADWQIANGVNLICPHLSAYSMRGCRKRDYPPNLFFQQPYWKHMKRLSDTLARTTALTSEGELVADTLVLHPMTSAWAVGAHLGRSVMDRLSADLARLTSGLSGMHADFEFGDEMIMERHARVQKGQIIIGKRRYRTVVVPSCLNWKAATLNLMKRFVRSKGRLIFAGELPTLIDGQASAELQAFARKQKQISVATQAGLGRLRTALKPGLRITPVRGTTDATDIAAMWRTSGREHLFFLVNLDPVKAHDLAVRLPVKGPVSRLDAATGDVTPLEARRAGTSQTVKLSLPAMGSTLLVVDPRGKPATPPKVHPRPRRKKALARRWQYHRRDPNAIVLDTARVTFGDEVFDKAMPLADINHMLLVRGESTVVELAYDFTARLDQNRRRLALAVENSEDYEIHINGLRVPMRTEDWWIDKCLRLLDISRLVSPGKNVLTLRRPYFIRADHRDKMLGNVPGAITGTLYGQVELEPVYLVGDFGVEFDGSHETAFAGMHHLWPPGEMTLEAWERQPEGQSVWLNGHCKLAAETLSGSGHNLLHDGLPFFAGTIDLEQTLVLTGNPSEQAVIEMPRPNAIVAQVIVNNHECPPLWQAPFRTLVGPYLQKGKNDLTIRLTGSLRNLMGPHHTAGGDYFMVGPESFSGAQHIRRGHLVDNHDYRADYNLTPFGLAGDVVLYY